MSGIYLYCAMNDQINWNYLLQNLKSTVEYKGNIEDFIMLRSFQF